MTRVAWIRANLALTVMVLVVACGSTVGSASPPPASTSVAVPALTPAPRTAAPVTDPESGLPVIALADLPPEAAATVALIEAGGPFPYTQDGATFQNRERSLPIRRSGYYREYTVESPGSDDRGPRRIVRGANGEMYWTADHYDSFAWIAR